MGETSLTDKLGIRQGRRVLVLDPPAGFVKRLDPLPEGVGVTTKIVSLADVILVFSSSRAVLGELFPKAKHVLAPRGALWVAWPRKSSGFFTDLDEPHPRGLPAACEAVAAYHGVSPDGIVLTASTSEGYSWLFKLLCDAGDEVLVPEPSYPLFAYLTALENVRSVPYTLRWDGEWHLEAKALRFSGRSRAVIVVSPGNPTGAYLKEEERAALAAACSAHACALISDEVFADFPAFDDPRRARSAVRYGDVLSFSLSGLSKVAGLPQLKLGWIAAAGPGADEAVRRLELIADSYLSVVQPGAV